MTCSCKSGKREFGAEICVHFPGIENLDKPPLFIFPKLSVCLDCGATEFVVGKEELESLRSGKAKPISLGARSGRTQ